MTARRRCLWLLAVVAVGVSAGIVCNRHGQRDALTPFVATESDEDVRLLAEGTNQFACDLYGKLRTTDGNLFVSPLSISTCLAMACAGGEGDTRDQMKSTLHLSLGEPRLHPAFHRFSELLTGAGGSRPYDLNVANAVWVHKGRPIREAYAALIRDQYAGDLDETSFAPRATSPAARINRWVARQTHGHIPRAVDPGTFDGATRMVLVNAIYFKGKWVSQFEKEQTRDGPFTLLAPAEDESPPRTVAVPMMHQRQQFSFMENLDLQLLSMPYRGDDIAMLVLLPKPDATGRHTAEQLDEMERLLTARSLGRWVDTASPCDVAVTFPKFTMTRELSLTPVLQSLGMTDAFDPAAADFSGIDGTRDLFIRSTRHVAYVDVDEEGTTAASATTISIGCGATDTREFTADHPFVFIIWHLPTRSILFMGRVIDPSAGSP